MIEQLRRMRASTKTAGDQLRSMLNGFEKMAGAEGASLDEAASKFNALFRDKSDLFSTRAETEPPGKRLAERLGLYEPLAKSAEDMAVGGEEPPPGANLGPAPELEVGPAETVAEAPTEEVNADTTLEEMAAQYGLTPDEFLDFLASESDDLQDYEPGSEPAEAEEPEEPEEPEEAAEPEGEPVLEEEPVPEELGAEPSQEPVEAVEAEPEPEPEPELEPGPEPGPESEEEVPAEALAEEEEEEPSFQDEYEAVSKESAHRIALAKLGFDAPGWAAPTAVGLGAAGLGAAAVLGGPRAWKAMRGLGAGAAHAAPTVAHNVDDAGRIAFKPFANVTAQAGDDAAKAALRQQHLQTLGLQEGALRPDVMKAHRQQALAAQQGGDQDRLKALNAAMMFLKTGQFRSRIQKLATQGKLRLLDRW